MASWTCCRNAYRRLELFRQSWRYRIVTSLILGFQLGDRCLRTVEQAAKARSIVSPVTGGICPYPGSV